ncbi:MAG: right-handed parallel beta-helix repeat-containing protein, partial [Promethearchaeota archaeon]
MKIVNKNREYLITSIMLTITFILMFMVASKLSYTRTNPESNDKGAFLPDGNFNIQDSTTHASILIQSNTELDAFISGEGFPGNGTLANPYIIENLEIDANATASAIDIQNTNEYLIIRNCSLINANSSSAYIAGLKLTNATNINATNNTIFNNRYGVYMLQSSNNTIYLNNVSGNVEHGINVRSISNDNHFFMNIIRENGGDGYIQYLASSNTIEHNNITNNTGHGIHFDKSSSNAVSYNIVENNSQSGIFLDSANSHAIINNNFTANDVGISISSSRYNNVSKNEISLNSLFGIKTDLNTQENNFSQNQILNNTNYGVFLTSSDLNRIVDNEISNTLRGIYMLQSNNNSIIGNNITGTSQDGIYIYSSSNNNSVIGNNVSKNTGTGVMIYTSFNTTIIS